MTALITHNNHQYKVNLHEPLDISIPLRASKDNVNAWYIDRPVIEPVKLDGWVGAVKSGASVNFNNIMFNPHAHGTHTECIGHITKEFHSINKNLKQFFCMAEVVSVTPEKQGDDSVITRNQLRILLNDKNPQALVIRTLPNDKSKLQRQYSQTNWPFLTEEATLYLREKDVEHLLIDLPSVDKEHDEGKLLSHKAFWNYDGIRRMQCTITEFIYVPDSIEDGMYLLNLQIAPFENDATPSKPILYKILE